MIVLKGKISEVIKQLKDLQKNYTYIKEVK